MATYEEKKKAVLDQYFRQYMERISKGMDLFNRLVPQHADGTLDLMHTMFLCSVIDHFGKIMRVGDRGTADPLGRGQNTANFTHFIENYFPPRDRCKGDIIYQLFRNGVMHQFFPKAAGVFWSNAAAHKDVLLDEYENHPRMNNYTFSNHIKAAVSHIINELEGDRMVSHVDAMYAHLIQTNYGFDDQTILQGLKTAYAARGKTLYDPC